MSWQRIKLSTLLSQRALSIDPRNFPDEVFSLYSIPAFDRGNPEILYGSDIGSSKQILHSGDVLLSKIVPHIRRCWVVDQSTPGLRQLGSGEWMVFRSDLIDSNYLSRVLVGDEVHREFMRTVAGVGGSLLRARPAAVAEIEIPLPPLDEQKRIAAVLDKANALRYQRQESLQLTERLLQSTFIDMFGDPSSNPKGWALTSLEELCDKIVDCPHSTPLYSEIATGFYCVRSSDIQNGKLDLDSTREVTESIFTERIARHEPKAGEVIYTREGGRLGFAAQVPHGKRVCLGQRMMLFRAKDRVSTNAFLVNLLNSASFRRIVQNLVGGGAAPRINIKDLKTIQVIQPPFALQQRFEKFTEMLSAEFEFISDSELQIQRLFNSIQQRAFQGKLDLSRLWVEHAEDLPNVSIDPGHRYSEGIYNRPGFFIAPRQIEKRMLELEDKLNTGPGDSIPWSEEYFKYRTLSQLLSPPFSFKEIWEKTFYDMEDSDYETVKDHVFKYVESGLLKQEFDEERKEIVFYPRP